MSKHRLERYSAAEIMASITAAKSDTRCDVLKELCPCRNQVHDIDVWREIFRAARDGNRRTRHRAAHAIATLLQKSQASARWRDLLRRLDAELERLMEKPDTAGPLLGQIAHQAGHAHTLRGSPVRTYRYQRRALNLASREALTDWVNAKLGLRKHAGVSSAHPGMDRLWRWLSHRATFQVRRRTGEAELLAKAEQWLPAYFERTRTPVHASRADSNRCLADYESPPTRSKGMVKPAASTLRPVTRPEASSSNV